MRVKRQHKRLSFMLLALTAASLLSTSDLSSSLLYRRELSLIDDRNINIEDKDVLVALDIQQSGMESFVENVIRNVKVDTPCQCKQEMTKCKCLNSQGNHWFFNTYNTTGYVCGDHADFTTLTNCPIDYWFRSTGGDTRPYRRYLIMTMLRDPVERYLSEWMFTRNEDTRFKNEPRLFRSDSTELQKKGLQCYVGKKLADLTIEEFMDCKENQAQNRQTRMLANLTYVSSLRLTGDDYDKALFESAKNTLQTIPFFALFDRPNDNLKLFERTFKLQISPPPTLSKDESKESLPVSAAVKHKIIQLNSLDLKLYVLAKEIYQGRVNEMRSSSSKKDEVDNFQIVYRPDLEDKDGEKDDEDDGDNDVVVEYDDGDNNEDEVKRQISAKKDGGDQSSLNSGEELVSSLSRDKEMSDDDNDDDDGVNDERVFIDDVEKRHDRIKEVYENDEGMMDEEEEEGREDKGKKVEYVEEEKYEEEEALNDKGKKEETDADEDITDEDNDGKIDEGNKSIEKSQSGMSEDANLKDNIQKSLPDYPMDEEDVSMFFNRLAQSRQQQQQQKQQFQQLLLQQQQQKQNPPPNQPIQNQQLQKQQPQAQQQQQNLVARAKSLASSLSSSKTSKVQAQLLPKSQPLQQKPPAQPRTQASADSSLSSKLNSGDIKTKLIQQLQSINKPSVPSSDKSASINNVGGISHGGGIKPLLSSKSEVKREAVAPLKGRSQEEKDLHRMFL